MIKLYTRLVRPCRTLNQLNRVHISLENRISPVEMAELEAQFPQHTTLNFSENAWRFFRKVARTLRLPRVLFRVAKNSFLSKEEKRKTEATAMLSVSPKSLIPKESYQWIGHMKDWCERSGKSTPEMYQRKRIAPGIYLYSTSDIPRRNKSLLVCLTGRTFRMMVPVPIFLQHIPASEFDIVILRDPTRRSYQFGIPGLGNSLLELIDSFDHLVDRRSYKSVMALGISGGGLPAVILSLTLGFDKAISVGGNSADDPRWINFGEHGICDTLNKLLDCNRKRQDLLFIYGANHQRDKQSALSFKQYLPCKILEIRSNSPGIEVQHNSLYPILAQSKLTPFIKDILSVDNYPFPDSEIEGVSYYVI